MHRKAIFVLGLILQSLVFIPHSSAQGIITTVAGGTPALPTVGPATSVPLGTIAGVTLDSAGNVYASDQGNFLVVRISTAGILTVVAGNGTRGSSGDGGSATSASLTRPTGLAVDTAGNIYIAEQTRIRRISPAGTITTVAGGAQIGFAGDGEIGRASCRERV